MLSFARARNKLEQWLLGQDKSISAVTATHISDEEPTPPNPDHDYERVLSFMKEIKASSQEWVGRIRLVNFDSIKARVGPTWPKLQNKVELLAEKIIRDQMSVHCRFLRMADAEFLVFFADISPEESRIRCLSVVEEIHQKLFGVKNQENNFPQRLAECHVAHVGDLPLEWEADGQNSRGDGDSSPSTMRGLFRQEAELLDGDDIVASTQTVLDAIISRAVESAGPADLVPLAARLACLSQNLKTLGPALAPIMERGSSFAAQAIDASDTAYVRSSEKNNDSGDTHPLGGSWDDISELISVLDSRSKRSHADLLTALRNLQLMRAEKAAKTIADLVLSSQCLGLDNNETRAFEFVPIYRYVARGEQVYQGIYRVDCRNVQQAVRLSSKVNLAESQHQEMADLERAAVEHAIRYWAKDDAPTTFTLMVPVNIETLRRPRSQRLYSTILRSSPLRTKRRLIIEVTGYRHTDNTIGFRRVVEELQIQSQAIFVTLSDKSALGMQKAAAECKSLGVRALGIDISPLGGSEAEIVKAVKQLTEVAERYSTPAYVSGIASVAVLAKAIAFGISYFSAPGLYPPRKTPGVTERAMLDELYSAV